MSYEDLEKARVDRHAKDAAKAKGKGKRGRKRKNPTAKVIRVSEALESVTASGDRSNEIQVAPVATMM